MNLPIREILLALHIISVIVWMGVLLFVFCAVSSAFSSLEDNKRRLGKPVSRS